MEITVFEFIFDSILNDDIDSFKKLLQICPLERMKTKSLDVFFTKMLTMMESYSRTTITKALFIEWERIYPKDSKLPFYVWLYLQGFIEIQVLQFCSKVYPEYTYMEVIDNLIFWDSAPEVFVACKKASVVYRDQPFEVYVSLLNTSDGINVEVYNALTPEVQKRAPYQVIPEWIYNFCNIGDKPLIHSLSPLTITSTQKGTQSSLEYQPIITSVPVVSPITTYVSPVSSITTYVSPVSSNISLLELCPSLDTIELPLYTFKEILKIEYIKKIDELTLNGKFNSLSNREVLKRIEKSILPTENIIDLAIINDIDNSPTFSLPNNRQIASLMTEGLDFNDPERENRYDNILAYISLMSDTEKRYFIRETMILKSLEGMGKDKRLFRLLGPVHPLIDSNVDDMQYGGCRMFTCGVYDEDDYGIVINWFTGNCQWCMKKIKRRSHAVRMPIPQGGWRGCYCDWGCIDDHLIDIELNGDGTTNVVIIVMLIQFFMKQLYDIGIQDILDSDDVVSESDNLSDTEDDKIEDNYFEKSEENKRKNTKEMNDEEMNDEGMNDEGMNDRESNNEEIREDRKNTEILSKSEFLKTKTNPILSRSDTPFSNIFDIKSTNEFLVSLNEHDEILLVYFYAPWCGYCKKMTPDLQTMVSNDKTLKLIKVNVDDPKLQIIISQYGNLLTSIPQTLIIPPSGSNYKQKIISGYNIPEIQSQIYSYK